MSSLFILYIVVGYIMLSVDVSDIARVFYTGLCRLFILHSTVFDIAYVLTVNGSIYDALHYVTLRLFVKAIYLVNLD